MERKTIAVVDDQPFICDLVKKLLGSDYEVHTFMNGKSMVDFAANKQIDLFLLDYDMPEMTGYEVLLALRTGKHNAKTPAIFLTAETNERMKKEMLGRGANDYLNKPINSTELRQCVKKYLSSVGG
ncbi:MAG: response regulator [Defluviitaleaceae bacterium]|nr:response regulator [Defluviitaleaceae bacterium]